MKKYVTCGKVEKVRILPSSSIQNKGRRGGVACAQTFSSTLQQKKNI